MSRALNRLLLPSRMLGKACLVTAMLTSIQAIALFGITDVMSTLFTPGASSNPAALAGLGKLLLSVMGLSGVYAGWLLTTQAGTSDADTHSFLSYLPASPMQLHRARLRTDLASFFLPTTLSLGIMLAAAYARGIATEVGVFAMELLAGLLLGLVVVKLTALTRSTSSLKKAVVMMIAFAPAIALLALSSLTLTTLAAVLALGLLVISWHTQPQPSFNAPTRLVEERQPDKMKAVGCGQWVLGKWMLRHTFLNWRIVPLAVVVMIFSARGLGEIDYSSYPQWGMLYYFLGVAVYVAAMVTKKVEALPLSKKIIFPYIVLPMFTLLGLSVAAVEVANVNGVSVDSKDGHTELPIRYEFDSSLTEKGSAQRLIVPPQLLEFSWSGQTHTVQGPDETTYQAQVMPLLWSTGPGYFNPFEVPEVKLESSPDATKLAFQMERALTAFYGSSLSAEELRARFIRKTDSEKVYFQRTEFEEWQRQWAASRQGEFLSQEDFWHQQVMHLMPARAIGWIIGWGIVLGIVFLMRARFVSRKRRVLQQVFTFLTLGVFLIHSLRITPLITGLILTDGFTEREHMAPSEAVRALLPDNLAFAWMTVAAVFCVTYHFAYRTYCNAEWGSKQDLAGLAKRNYEKWANI